MGGKQSRDKGQRGERNVVYKLNHLWKNARRNLNDFNEEEGIDIANTGKLAIQVKHYKKHVPFTKINEIRPSDKTLIPLLVSWPTDKGTGKPMVALYLDDFINIIENPDVLEMEKEC